MTTQLDDFETRLLHTLREQVTQHQSTAPRRSRGPRRLALTAGAVAAAATGLLLIPGLGTSPAYSVQEGNAGEIIVEINAPTDASGLQRALQEHGIAADITYLPELQTCAPGRYVEVDRSLSGLTTSIGSESIGVTIPPGAIRDGETFVLSWSVLPMSQAELDALNTQITQDGGTTTEGAHATLTAGVAAGPVQPCTPVPAESATT